MRRLILLLLCCLLGPGMASAQVLQGYVSDYDTEEVLAAVSISNKTRMLTTLSDMAGRFTIAAGKGDQIEFSMIGYAGITIIMPADTVIFRRVGIKKKMFELDMVHIGPNWTPYQRDSIERRRTYALDLARTRYSSSVLGSVMHPASALAEQFSKKSKQRFRFQKNFAKWEDEHFVNTRYTFEEVAALTGLSGDTLAAFINSHPMPADYARTASDLEIKMWIKYNYRQWIKGPIVVPQLPDSMRVQLKPPSE
jgi:hypothetical protein